MHFRLLCTYRANGKQYQRQYNCDTIGHASVTHEKERAKPTCVRIETLLLVDEWRTNANDTEN